MENLSVKNVKLHEDMSEETPCFSADLYDNDVLVAHVKNDGRGGSNTLYAPDGGSRDLYEKYGDLKTDCHIMALAEDYAVVGKYQSKNWVLKSKEGSIATVSLSHSIAQLKKRMKPDAYEKAIKEAREKWSKKGYEIINRNL